MADFGFIPVGCGCVKTNRRLSFKLDSDDGEGEGYDGEGEQENVKRDWGDEIWYEERRREERTMKIDWDKDEVWYSDMKRGDGETLRKISKF